MQERGPGERRSRVQFPGHTNLQVLLISVEGKASALQTVSPRDRVEKALLSLVVNVHSTCTQREDTTRTQRERAQCPQFVLACYKN